MQDLLGLETLTLLGFMAAFHILGGGALGIGARQWRSSWASGVRRSPPFLALWGALFGGIPLAMGAALQNWVLLAGQGAILLASIAIAFFLSVPVRDFFRRQYPFMVGFGVLLMAAGGLTTWLMLRGDRQTVAEALTYGGLVFLAGTLALSAGLVQWIRGAGKARKEKEPLPPEPELGVVLSAPAKPSTSAPVGAGPETETVPGLASAPQPEPGPEAKPSTSSIGDMLSPTGPADLRSPVDEAPPESKTPS